MGADVSPFLEALLVEAGDAASEYSGAVYDERRSLTVLPDGTALIETAAFGSTSTFTRQTIEADDRDASDMFGGTRTKTAIAEETDDDDFGPSWASTRTGTKDLSDPDDRD